MAVKGILKLGDPVLWRKGALIKSAEIGLTGFSGKDEPPFIVANSMREVQPEINLLVSPIPENLVYFAPRTAPRWELPEDKP